MLTKEQVRTMLSMQSAMNGKVNPDWVNADNNWLLAATLEAAEAVDHHGWKWWKKQTPNMPQLRMELVDIWHFILSEWIVTSDGDLELAEASVTHMASPARFIPSWVKGNDLLGNLQYLISTLAAGDPSVPEFMYVLAQAGMSTDDLYRQYVGKNVLNFFRQDHGYKEGTYVKVWDGREDNEHLTEILDTLSADDPDLDSKLATALNERYRELCL
ncbi:dUTP diphosphatase [Salinimonas marina]|uniref:dUTP diphosphatase n=1 Tax=Salinimonas marina TaxID=2785918 RepID=A0A7S9DZT5_9ALTE|nr:dUTP diphosphatase [Salinimonas marina]QPG06927.1 dUTP diphosphatase [Salinimonas marina]